MTKRRGRREPQPDLELISTQTLMRELLNRCDHGAITILRETGKNSRSAVNTMHTGNRHMVLGLIDDLHKLVLEDRQIVQDVDEMTEGDPPDPPDRDDVP